MSASFMKEMHVKMFYTLMGVSILVRSELNRERNSAQPDADKIADMEAWLRNEETYNR